MNASELIGWTVIHSLWQGVLTPAEIAADSVVPPSVPSLSRGRLWLLGIVLFALGAITLTKKRFSSVRC